MARFDATDAEWALIEEKERNTVERCFQKVKTWRGLATRCGKAPESHEAGLYLRGSITWPELLTSTA
ncbi:hypothetical protein [Streptosporangium pseudovulgare]|uniref:Transposase n=1 Tax=Streptosporangium pseudovulgare TaxID=35765 RepID=A0ABQ2RAZ0_9ACTN|nr:hypothetical protein [Streptosporangium pseudovulgare]GGQ18706.1 hypothetical protein GCM10010140_56470 [Streptosporangium pseudovulgare]